MAELQEATLKAGRETAEAFQVSTREDVAQVARLVVGIEHKVDQVSDHAVEFAGRLRSLPLAALGQLTERLATIEAKLEALSAPPRAVSGGEARTEKLAQITNDDPATEKTGTPAPARAATTPRRSTRHEEGRVTRSRLHGSSMAGGPAPSRRSDSPPRPGGGIA